MNGLTQSDRDGFVQASVTLMKPRLVPDSKTGKFDTDSTEHLLGTYYNLLIQNYLISRKPDPNQPFDYQQYEVYKKELNSDDIKEELAGRVLGLLLN